MTTRMNGKRCSAWRADRRGCVGANGIGEASVPRDRGRPIERPDEPSPRLFGYARVSTTGQNLDRQLRALREFGVPERWIFKEKASGKDFDRPAWSELIGLLRPGDVIAVTSLDRMGRDYGEILTWWHRIVREAGCDIVVLDMPLLDTRSSSGEGAAGVGGVTGALIADLMLQLLSYVAQVERESIKQRQAEGIAAAKARGVRFGRPPKQRPPEWAELRRMYLAGRITRTQAAARAGVCVSTFDRWMRANERSSPDPA